MRGVSRKRNCGWIHSGLKFFILITYFRSLRVPPTRAIFFLSKLLMFLKMFMSWVEWARERLIIKSLVVFFHTELSSTSYIQHQTPTFNFNPHFQHSLLTLTINSPIKLQLPIPTVYSRIQLPLPTEEFNFPLQLPTSAATANNHFRL